MPDELNVRWMSWLNLLPQFRNIEVPRCIKPANFNDAFLSLHVFCDASEKAYGCCIYLRCVNKTGSIHVALVCGKNKLAHMKTMIIPRLELLSAHLAVNMETKVKMELNDVFLGESTFWSDSKIVLAYIKNTTSRYHVFVANRISNIHLLSSTSQWNHIAGKNNPADLLTRGITISQLTDEWLNGPNFLWLHRCDWSISTESSFAVPMGDPEVKTLTTSHDVIIKEVEEHPIDKLIAYYSSWSKLKRAVSYIIKVKELLTKRCVNSHLTLSDLQKSELLIVSHVQQRFYAKDIGRLASHRSVWHAYQHTKEVVPIIE